MLHEKKTCNYNILIEDVESIKTFWSKMKTVDLNALQSLDEEHSEMAIAYERYNECTQEGASEKRISNAVMGLESLYVKGNDEVSFKLRMRASRFFKFSQ
jgi:hypothetical protein